MRGASNGIGGARAASPTRARAVLAVAVLSAALTGCLLCDALPAQAAPAGSSHVAPEPGPTTSPARRGAAAPATSVWPRPQQLRLGDGQVALAGRRVAVLAAPDVDPYALGVVEDALGSARSVEVLSPVAPLPRGADVVVRLEENPAGGEADASPRGGRTEAELALRALGAEPQGDLPAGGYRLAAGGRTVVLAGVGADGLFNAAQTLRQLAVDGDAGALRAVRIRDWPSAAVRGTAEAFYGEPWSHQQRLAYLDFMGRTKQNRYLYAPGDDPYRQSEWREPYPAGRRAEFRELTERARRNHVTPAWAVAPGQNYCFSSRDDERDLLRKAEEMRELGFGAFQLQFPDVSYDEWHCRADREEFGTGPGAAARAHARTANALAARLGGEGAPALSLLPTEYFQEGGTEYRRALADALDPGVEVAWTGVGVLPRTITGAELGEALAVFGHPVVTQDNYPVNDFDAGRVFLGPYTGREPAVATGSAALLAGAMEQPLASRIPLFTAADFAWNARAYDPKASWSAALDELARGSGLDREALAALAGNSASSALDERESAYLKPLLARFTRAYESGDRAALERAAGPLREAFTTMREAPGRLGALSGELRPWLRQLARYGEAGDRAVEMMLAQARGRSEQAWRARLELDTLRGEIGGAPGRVGEGVLGPFAATAVASSDSFTGASAASPKETDTALDGKPGTARRPRGAEQELVLPLDGRPLQTLTLLTEPRTAGGSPYPLAAPAVELFVPGEGWRRAGELAASGFTELAPRGARADAVRLTWTGGAAPAVHEVIPWAEGTERTRLELPRPEVDVAIGGTATVEATLSGHAPRAVRAALRAAAPRGLKVSAPRSVDVPRGGTATVRLRISAPKGAKAGTYTVPVRLAGGEERTLTVRAYPRTAGPDLARGGSASSSGDETPDFPAPAVVDGDPATRWSSPARDDAWIQVALGRPARVGEVVLHWQDAYAARYRIEVSADGRRWRTAAVVGRGRGGRESVRMDEPGVRFVRVHGDQRGTEFGYSLWSVEVRAIG
ncbi:beta-N-acetylglucosaminidase domain-containing protein [Streptomyces sp. NPDC051940]|uniref:beta-N-acetylglucosaminidase domain-containing protein n=1 Tax=Streptomyces sp. NPDC051940 TaxID=3155675 RepID=UPI003440715E